MEPTRLVDLWWSGRPRQVTAAAAHHEAWLRQMTLLRSHRFQTPGSLGSYAAALSGPEAGTGKGEIAQRKELMNIFGQDRAPQSFDPGATDHRQPGSDPFLVVAVR